MNTSLTATDKAKTLLTTCGIQVHQSLPIQSSAGLVSLQDIVKATKALDGFVSFIWVVTPEDAKWLLDNQAPNRALSQRNVLRLAQDIQMGHYIYNGLPILLDSEGKMMDGQHRCRGSVQADLPIVTRIEMGLGALAYQTIDVGSRPRNMAHILTIEGMNKTLAGWVQVVSNWLYRLSSPGSISGRHSPSPHTLSLVHRRYPQLIEETKVFTSKEARRSLAKHRQFFAAAYLMAREFSEDKAEAFFVDQMVYGEGITRKDPAYHLRNRISTIAEGGSDVPRDWTTTKYVTAMLFKAWNAFVQGRKVTKFTYSIKHNLPIPTGFEAWGSGIHHFLLEGEKAPDVITS